MSISRNVTPHPVYQDAEKGHPIPDLVVEVDRNSDSGHKIAPYLRMGVREAWTSNAEDGVVIWLVGDEASIAPAHDPRSRVFPGLAREDLNRLLDFGTGFEQRFRLSRELAGQVAQRLLA